MVNGVSRGPQTAMVLKTHVSLVLGLVSNTVYIYCIELLLHINMFPLCVLHMQVRGRT